MTNNFTLGYLPKINKNIQNICSHKGLYANVYSSIMHNCQKSGNNPNVYKLVTYQTAIFIQWTIIQPLKGE